MSRTTVVGVFAADTAVRYPRFARAQTGTRRPWLQRNSAPPRRNLKKAQTGAKAR